MATGGTTRYTSEDVHDDIQQRDLPVVKYCDSCRYDGTQEEASGFCVQCTEYLCEVCFRVHGKSKTTRNHILLKQDEMPADKEAFETINKLTKCDVHPHHDFAYECVEHNSFICALCLSDTHRKCEGIIDLSACTAIDDAGLSMFYDKKDQLHVLTSETDCSAQEIGNRVKTVEEEVKSWGEELKQKIDVLRDKLLEEIKDVMNSETEKNTESHSGSKQFKTDIEKGKHLFDTVKAYGTKQQIAIVIKHTKHLKENIAKDISNFKRSKSLLTLTLTKDLSLQEINSIGKVQLLSLSEDEHASCGSDALSNEENTSTVSDTNTVHATENATSTSLQDVPQEPQRQLTVAENNRETSDVYCEISSTPLSAPKIKNECRNDAKASAAITTPLPQSCLPFGFPKSYAPLIDRCFGQCSMIHNVRTSTDKTLCVVTSIIRLGNGHIVLADNANFKIKMFSNKFDFLDEVQLPGSPLDMCNINDEIYVCCYQIKRIFHIAVEGNTLSSNLRSYATRRQPLSVSTIDSEVVILFGNVSSGKVVDVNIEIREGSSIRTNVSYPTSNYNFDHLNDATMFLHTLNSNEILLSENDRVSCYEIDRYQEEVSNRLWYYKSHRENILEGALGLTIDSEDNVYVCGYNSNNVHQVSSQNYRMNQVVVPYIERPLSVCVHEENDRLLVGCEKDDYVHSYSMM